MAREHRRPANLPLADLVVCPDLGASAHVGGSVARSCCKGIHTPNPNTRNRIYSTICTSNAVSSLWFRGVSLRGRARVFCVLGQFVQGPQQHTL
eukprot:1348946-Rhodomonas_salina.1